MRKLLAITTVASALLLGAGATFSKPAPSKSETAPSVPASAVSPDRLDRLSRAYLGVPYVLDCLGEGSGIDPDPLFTRKAADCQTLVEQVMAEALAPHVGGLEEAGRWTRYRNREVRFENRYHFCLPDWLENPWPARDITSEVGGANLPLMEKDINLRELVRKRGGDVSLTPAKPQRVAYRYIPREQIARVASRIPNGTIAILVSTNPIVVSGHMGFLFRQDGQTLLRHASQTRKKVIQEPLTTYFERAPKSFIGLMVLQPDVNGLKR